MRESAAFDLAFERAGMDCVGQVEIDAKCREVLHNHWPHVPKWSDVKEVDGGWFGTVDVLAGGFPCQDYSVAGKRGGLVGDRGALWWQFHRLIAECRPRWVVGENVPGLLSSNGGRDFGAIVGSLVELGYGVVWRVLDAQYFGVAQRRRRVFIVGHSGGIPRPEVLAFAEGCAGDTPPVRGQGEGTADHVATSLKATGKQDHVGDESKLVVARTLTQGAPSAGRRNEDDYNLVFHKSSMDAGWEPGVRTLRARDSKGDSHVVVGFSVGSSDVAVGGPIAPSVTARHGDQGGVAIQEAQTGVREYDTSGTLRADAPGHQPTGTLVRSASAVRRLTPLECERLQGFPDNWTAGQSDTQRYRQMGNAVAVPVVEWIGRNLAKADLTP